MRPFTPSVVVVLGCVSLAAFGQERRQVLLADAMRLAAQNNHDYAAALANARIVEAQASRVWGAILPEITANGSLVNTSAVAQFDLSPLVGVVGGVYGLNPVNPSLTPAPYNIIAANSAYGNVQISQILFTPQLFLVPAAKPGIEAAKLGAQEAREQVLLGVARVYLGVQGLMQLEGAAKDAEAVALKREKDVMGQVAAGTEGEIASLRAQTETAQARGLLAQLAGQREGLLATLESLVGEPIEPGNDVTGLTDKGPAEETSEPWNAKYAVRANKRGVASQETFVFYDRLMFLPTLMGIAKGAYNSNLGFVTSHFTYDLTLSLSIPLYDRGLRYSLLHEDEAKLEGARQKLESEKAGARAGWRTAKANLTAAQAALVQAEAQAALATKAQKQADGAFQVGLTTALELSDIDNKRFLAASQVAQVRAQLEVRKVEMIAAEGRLAQVIGLE